MRGLIRIGILLALPLLLFTPLGAAVIHVPADQPSIQAGMDAAGSGDTVLVADGTWSGPGNRNLDFGGKAITVVSAGGSGSCIIDCGGGHDNGFVLDSNEGRNSVISGFTVRNGFRGIYCPGSSPAIVGNVITGFETGVQIYQDSPLITGNTISYCSSSGVSGFFYTTGGSGRPVITGNTISGNSENGISFYSDYGSPFVEIVANVIEGNGGSGIDAGGHITLTVTGNTISGNGGGGIHLSGGEASGTVEDNVITGNSAEFGGGVSLYGGVLRNNLILNNHASDSGGGIYAPFGSPTITNCTVVGNSAGTRGGGLDSRHVYGLFVASCIFRENQAPAAAEIYAGPGHQQVEIRVRYSNISGGVDGIVLEPGWGQVHLGPGLIDADPLFVSGPNGDHYLSQVAAGQDAESPSVDTGDPGEVTSGTTRTDEAADTGIEDQGYHYQSYGAHCDLDGSGRVDGTDLAILGRAFGSFIGDWRYSAEADIDGSGVVDGIDLALLAEYFGTGIV